MDFCRNVSVEGEYQQEKVLSPPCSKLGALTSTGSLDDLFSAPNTEVDVSLEWLSIFVEDCFSSSGSCLPAASPPTNVQNTSTTEAPKVTKPLQLQQKSLQTPPSLQKFVVPGKARSKRKRATAARTRLYPLSSLSHHLNPHNQTLQLVSSDPPLLQQAYWLADSELIMPQKEDTKDNTTGKTNTNDKENSGNTEITSEKEGTKEVEKEKMMTLSKEGLGLGGVEGSSGQQPRRCTHCLAQRTPQWRAGPLGPKTLCNACGVRYKSGRLLPEYRPAKSPTFVSYLHSNSHKKVMEMRMALLSSIPSQE